MKIFSIIAWLTRTALFLLYLAIYFRFEALVLRVLMVNQLAGLTQASLLKILDMHTSLSIFYPKRLRWSTQTSLPGALALCYYLRLGESLALKLLAGVLLALLLGNLLVVLIVLVQSYRSLASLRAIERLPNRSHNSPSFALVDAHHLGRWQATFASLLRNASLSLWLARSPTLIPGIRQDSLASRLESAETDSESSIAAARNYFRIISSYYTAPRCLLGYLDARELAKQQPELLAVAVRKALAALVVLNLSSSLSQVVSDPLELRRTFLSTDREVRDRQLAHTLPDNRLLENIHLCPGPVFLLSLSPTEFFLEDIPEETPLELVGYSLPRESSFRLRRTHSEVKVTLLSSALPLARSDQDQAEQSRGIPHELASRGFAPLADAYLRFRLARSGVERFAILLECFEVLLKAFVISLFSYHSSVANIPEEVSELVVGNRKPALGAWRKAAELLAKQKSANASPTVAKLKATWFSASVPTTMREVVTLAHARGFSYQGKVPTTLNEWTEWLVWLRNNTRGHGALNGASLEELWHPLHGAFLEAVIALRPLTLESTICLHTEEFGEIEVYGWRRGPYRSSTQDRSPLELTGKHLSTVLRGVDGDLPVEDFFRIRGNECWVWSGRHKKKLVDYIDYASGSVRRLEVA